jgi:general secretion pathway protein A
MSARGLSFAPMYASYFGLKSEPFALAPDPRYLFMSERHREALAHLLYGVGGGGGFVVLSGEIGAGKTTVCRCFLEQIPKRCNVAYIFNPKLSAIELLQTVCEEFRIPPAPGEAQSVKALVDRLNEFLLRTHAVGQNNVLIIDEAQSLAPDVLEQLRLLTNLETNERKLLQIVLIGQPELRTMLARPELEQLAQRVIARFHLEALSEAETVQYIRHRLRVAGLARSNPFDKAAMRRIHQLARGVPRRINLLADRAMLGAYATEQPRVTRALVDAAAREVFDGAPAVAQRRLLWWGGGALAATAAVVAVAAWLAERPPASRSGPAPALASASAPSAAASPVALAPPAASAPPAAPALPPWLPDKDAAWTELASVWGVGLVAGTPPCLAAEQQHALRCFEGRGDVAALKRLARPALVALRDADGGVAWGVLTGLDEQRALLRRASRIQEMPAADFAARWNGDFGTLWRAPPGYRQPIGPGADGPLVGWLATQLALARGEPAPDKPPIEVNGRLVARLQAFQRAQGLQADGLAGPITLMQLNRATGVAEPRFAP